MKNNYLCVEFSPFSTSYYGTTEANVAVALQTNH